MEPDVYTLGEHYLDVGNGHSLYIHDWGNAKAKVPIIFLHGGPGGGVSDRYKQRFVPEQQRVIFFDQRGCGKSTPKGSLKHNTTNDLVEDIEKIAKSLKLKKFILVGGSWGSCLALAYGVAYPKRLEAMVLSGIFTGTKAEIDYLDNGETWRHYYPDVWDTYLSRTPKRYHSNPTAYHYKMILGKDEEKSKRSAYAQQEMEGSLVPLDDRHQAEPYETFDPTCGLLEAHYLSNHCFLPEKYIVKNAKKLTMPIWLVQGRYDMVCPPITAYELNKVLPKSHLIWTVAGHGNDRPNYDACRTLLLQLTS